ncbi:hypothetical protein [Streptomyces sp. GC420]|uniref:hypothetical protein n=1 Tax=Streptomyces sp. GC420 TaxID=2697568 RepID=UPI001414D5BD|nr:hypothetical protein [Streptomyces sp. GC420]NBM15105.1 hypothetical protein [Streptomyces sp. GC420]
MRNRPWVVTEGTRSALASDDQARAAEATHLVRLVSLEDDARDEELRVVWELERATEVYDGHVLPSAGNGFAEPDRLDAFLDAVRWGADDGGLFPKPNTPCSEPGRQHTPRPVRTWRGAQSVEGQGLDAYVTKSAHAFAVSAS